MKIEYVAIVLAPLLTVINQKNSVDVHLGYDLDGSYDQGLLAFSVVTSLVFELAVDTICFKVQKKWFNLRDAWTNLALSGKRWKRMFPNMLLFNLFASILMLNGFFKMQHSPCPPKISAPLLRTACPIPVPVL
jgi:hypothetical protein